MDDLFDVVCPFCEKPAKVLVEWQVIGLSTGRFFFLWQDHPDRKDPAKLCFYSGKWVRSVDGLDSSMLEKATRVVRSLMEGGS